MIHLVTDDFSQEQMFILKLRNNHVTYSDIINEFNKKFKKSLYDCKITTCLRRSSMGYKWSPGNVGGNDPYLCSHDLKELKDTIIDVTSNGVPMDCDSVLDEAKSLKINRLLEGMKFLSSVNSNRLSSDLSEFIIKPTRQWINLIIDELDLHIINQRLIDQKRLDGCSISTIDEFFTKYGEFISRFHPIMIFGADETMLDPQPRKKVVVPKEIQVILHENLLDMEHISGMMCHNVAGVALPPFIILSKLKNLPNE